ncbi:MAG: RNA 2',3'-cyclic phosphodiesterase [Eubacteriales bacterium]|nr:RNA 2',3'-cyclic phosphodiesterase [Eubacteriales bacterium]
MRLFFAIPLPPDILRAVSSARVALEQFGAGGRLVPRENYHVTLHFIGETDALVDATDALREAVRDIRPFVLRLGGYGSFKTDGSHTGFIRVSCDGDELNCLYESLESALWERGFAKNRGRLTPHITLGRGIEGDEGFVLPPQKAAFTANSVVLYESRSERGKMIYTPLHREMFL